MEVSQGFIDSQSVTKTQRRPAHFYPVHQITKASKGQSDNLLFPMILGLCLADGASIWKSLDSTGGTSVDFLILRSRERVSSHSPDFQGCRSRLFSHAFLHRSLYTRLTDGNVQSSGQFGISIHAQLRFSQEKRTFGCPAALRGRKSSLWVVLRHVCLFMVHPFDREWMY